MTPVARTHFCLGLTTAIALPAWIVGFSLLGVGSLARDAGHPLGAALLSTVLVWAGPAQLILYGTLAGGGLTVAAALAVALSGIRLLPMTLAIWPYLRRPGQSLLTQILIAHLVAATTWIDGMRRLPTLEPEARLPDYLGFGTTCLAVSTAMTAIGYVLVGALPAALAAGLLCLTPIYFGISLIGSARAMGDYLAVGLGFALLPGVQALVGPDFDLLVTGLIGGALAYGALRWREGDRA